MLQGSCSSFIWLSLTVYGQLLTVLYNVGDIKTHHIYCKSAFLSESESWFIPLGPASMSGLSTDENKMHIEKKRLKTQYSM